jgi:hypothetical protein
MDTGYKNAHCGSMSQNVSLSQRSTSSQILKDEGSAGMLHRMFFDKRFS